MQKQKMIIEVKNVKEEGDDEFPSLVTTKNLDSTLREIEMAYYNK